MGLSLILPPGDVLPRRERQTNMAAHTESEATPRHILEAAMNVIARHKISGTRMRQIAQQAGISQGTLHYHFASKADLLLALLDEMERAFDEDRRRRLAASTLGPEEMLRIFCDQQRWVLTQRPELEEVFFDFWGQGMIDPRIRPKIRWMYEVWRQDIAAIVERGVREGVFSPRYAHLVPAVFVSLMEGAALQHLIDETVFDLDEYLALIYDLIISLLKGTFTLPLSHGTG